MAAAGGRGWRRSPPPPNLRAPSLGAATSAAVAEAKAAVAEVLGGWQGAEGLLRRTAEEERSSGGGAPPWPRSECRRRPSSDGGSTGGSSGSGRWQLLGEAVAAVAWSTLMDTPLAASLPGGGGRRRGGGQQAGAGAGAGGVAADRAASRRPGLEAALAGVQRNHGTRGLPLHAWPGSRWAPPPASRQQRRWRQRRQRLTTAAVARAGVETEAGAMVVACSCHWSSWGPGGARGGVGWTRLLARQWSCMAVRRRRRPVHRLCVRMCVGATVAAARLGDSSRLRRPRRAVSSRLSRQLARSIRRHWPSGAAAAASATARRR